MSTCASVSRALGTQGAVHLGQKLLNRKMSSIPGAAWRPVASSVPSAPGPPAALSPPSPAPSPGARQGFLPGQGEPPSPPGRQGQGEGGCVERRHRGLLNDAVSSLDHFAGGRGRQGVQVGGCRENPDRRSAEAGRDIAARSPRLCASPQAQQPGLQESWAQASALRQPPGCCGREVGKRLVPSAAPPVSPSPGCTQGPSGGSGRLGVQVAPHQVPKQVCVLGHVCVHAVPYTRFLPAEAHATAGPCFARVPST